MLSLIQSLKAETRVKTEGFLSLIQPKGPKLTIPCTSQVVLVPVLLQENGPPESPCRTEVQAGDKRQDLKAASKAFSTVLRSAVLQSAARVIPNNVQSIMFLVLSNYN